MEQREKKNGMVEVSCDAEHVLHRIGSADYPEIRRAIVRAEDVDCYEEVAVDAVPQYTREDYKARVVALLRERYDADDEIAILRQRDSKPTEYAAYNAYVEECKARVREELGVVGSV